MADRITRETESLLKMVEIFCNGHHGFDGELCDDCRDLSENAMACVSLCPYGAGKPVCGRCPTNCFPDGNYARIKTVMRYAGPKMLYKHPLLTAIHLFDAMRKHR